MCVSGVLYAVARNPVLWTSPSSRKTLHTFSLYSNVVLPALSCICNQLPASIPLIEASALTSPRISIRISFFAHINFENVDR
jgi:hypothetical protein